MILSPMHSGPCFQASNLTGGNNTRYHHLSCYNDKVNLTDASLAKVNSTNSNLEIDMSSPALTVHLALPFIPGSVSFCLFRPEPQMHCPPRRSRQQSIRLLCLLQLLVPHRRLSHPLPIDREDERKLPSLQANGAWGCHQAHEHHPSQRRVLVLALMARGTWWTDQQRERRKKEARASS